MLTTPTRCQPGRWLRKHRVSIVNDYADTHFSQISYFILFCKNVFACSYGAQVYFFLFFLKGVKTSWHCPFNIHTYIFDPPVKVAQILNVYPKTGSDWGFSCCFVCGMVQVFKNVVKQTNVDLWKGFFLEWENVEIGSSHLFIFVLL